MSWLSSNDAWSWLGSVQLENMQIKSRSSSAAAAHRIHPFSSSGPFLARLLRVWMVLTYWPKRANSWIKSCRLQPTTRQRADEHKILRIRRPWLLPKKCGPLNEVPNTKPSKWYKRCPLLIWLSSSVSHGGGSWLQYRTRKCPRDQYCSVLGKENFLSWRIQRTKG